MSRPGSQLPPIDCVKEIRIGRRSGCRTRLSMSPPPVEIGSTRAPASRAITIPAGHVPGLQLAFPERVVTGPRRHRQGRAPRRRSRRNASGPRHQPSQLLAKRVGQSFALAPKGTPVASSAPSQVAPEPRPASAGHSDKCARRPSQRCRDLVLDHGSIDHPSDDLALMRSSPIEIAKCGRPCRKFVVPSSGSTIQRRDWGPCPSPRRSPRPANHRPGAPRISVSLMDLLGLDDRRPLTKSPAPLTDTCRFSTSPKSRASCRPALRAASTMMLMVEF